MEATPQNSQNQEANPGFSIPAMLGTDETDDERSLRLVDNPQLYNRILSAVFLIYAFFMGSMCWTVSIIMTKTSAEDRMDMNVRYHVYVLGYFIAVIYLGASSRKYHHRFPHNLIILLAVFSAVVFLYTQQVMRFNPDHAQLSDIPAMLFGFVSFVLLWLVSLVAHFSPASYVGRVMRLLIVVVAGEVVTVAHNLEKDYRYVSLLLIGLGVVHCIFRAENLARKAQRDLVDLRVKDVDRIPISNANVWIHAIRISLQIILWPMVVFSGVLVFAAYVMRPNIPSTGDNEKKLK